MNHVSNCELKKVFICLFCLGLLVIGSGPSVAAELNLASSQGSALLDWGQTGFVFSLTPNTAIITFLEKNSFSSAWAGVKGKDTDPGQSDFFEDVPDDPVAFPPDWRGTAFTANFLGYSGSAIGNADTAFPPTPVPVPPTLPVLANRNFAASDVRLTKFGDADVFIAQAVIEGPFTVDQDCTLSVTVPYALVQDLSSKFGTAAFSDVAVSLTVYDLNTYNPTTGNSVILPGSISVSSLKELKAFWANPPAVTQSGNLTLTVNLIANDPLGNPIVYDFEAAASTIASAWAPSRLITFPKCWWWLSRVRG
jgi:hypothetical protein